MPNVLNDFLDIDEEDDLTKAVFGSLELAGSDVLNYVFESHSFEFDDSMKFRYHDRIHDDATRWPDVIIENERISIIVEAKRGPEYSSNQLIEENEDLEIYGSDEKHLLLITGHTAEPSDLDDLDIEQLEWIGWRDVALSLHNLDQDSLHPAQQKIIKLLIDLLKEEGYVPFDGFQSELLDRLEEPWDILKEYYNQVNTFRRDVEGLIRDEDLVAKNLYRDGTSQSLNRFPIDWEFLTDHLWVVYGEPEFEVNNKGQHYLFTCFNTKTGNLRVGFSIRPEHSDEENFELIQDHADKIVQFVQNNDAKVFKASWNFTNNGEFVEEDALNAFLKNEDNLKDAVRVQIGYDYTGDLLHDKRLSEEVAEKLIRIHEFTYPLLYPDEA